jgi:hypothetical protein
MELLENEELAHREGNSSEQACFVLCRRCGNIPIPRILPNSVYPSQSIICKAEG